MIWLKLFLVPGLVAIVTLAVRRWGPSVGGWLAGLPIVAGPVLVIYALEQGNTFATAAAHATLTGLIATVAFAVAYGHLSTRLPWYVCMALGWCVFAAVVVSLYALQPGLIVSLLLLVAATVLGRHVLPRDAVAIQPASSIRGDLITRLVATATLVLVLTGLAGRLGPAWSGLLNAFPVLTTIVAVFSHIQRGAAAAVAFLNGYLQAIVGFGLFCVVMATGLESLGLGWALGAALAVQLAWHGVLVSRAAASASHSPS
jgi:hypothetical protein